MLLKGSLRIPKGFLEQLWRRSCETGRVKIRRGSAASRKMSSLNSFSMSLQSRREHRAQVNHNPSPVPRNRGSSSDFMPRYHIPSEEPGNFFLLGLGERRRRRKIRKKTKQQTPSADSKGLLSVRESSTTAGQTRGINAAPADTDGVCVPGQDTEHLQCKAADSRRRAGLRLNSPC